MDSNPISVNDFLKLKALSLRDSKNKEQVIVKEDIKGVNGNSLHDHYSKLWTMVNEYNMNIMMDNTSINNAFKEFYNYPFSKIAEILTDEMRENLTRVLGLGFPPYTKRQAISVYNLRNRYPVKEEEIKAVKNILSLLESRYTCKTNCDKLELVKTINKILCVLNQKYLWMVADKVIEYYRALDSIIDHKEIDSALEYLNEYKKTISKDELLDIDAQFVDDVTNLIPFTYPHPEVYFAFVNALKFINLYYGPIKGSKLFSTDVVGIMKRYLLRVEQSPGIDFLSKFRLYEDSKDKTMPETNRKTEECGCTKFPTITKEETTDKTTSKRCCKPVDQSRKDKLLATINHKLVDLEVENLKLKSNLKDVGTKTKELVNKTKILDTVEPVEDFEGNVLFSAFKAE